MSKERDQNLSLNLPKAEVRNTERVRNAVRLPQLGRSGTNEVKEEVSNYGGSLTKRSVTKLSLDSGTASSVNINYDEKNDIAQRKMIYHTYKSVIDSESKGMRVVIKKPDFESYSKDQ